MTQIVMTSIIDCRSINSKKRKAIITTTGMLVFWFQSSFRRTERIVKALKAKLSHNETIDKQTF